MKYHPRPIFRCDPIWRCYRLVSRAKVIENQILSCRIQRIPRLLTRRGRSSGPTILDYVTGPEYPHSPVCVPYVPKLAYPEFMPPEDDVLPAEEQPLPAAVSPTADSPGYITEFDPEEDLEDNDEEPEEDPTDYPDDRDDDEEESSGDDADGRGGGAPSSG
ncbi:hypothetical protein Tco_0951966 [Tanacetum coccineum]|uniref:Uncharacterized protein n=1 Tax=Tanacetum coccineum TaxID=301880 RepID=A0ABQ5DVN3_9ASTR